MKNDPNKLIVATQDRFFLYDLSCKDVVKHLKTKKDAVPFLVDVSSDGHYSLEVSKEMPTTVFLRSLKTNSI